MDLLEFDTESIIQKKTVRKYSLGLHSCFSTTIYPLMMRPCNEKIYLSKVSISHSFEYKC